MYKLTVWEDGKKNVLEFSGNPTVQQVLEENGVIMPHPCSGRGICGKCVIEIQGAISSPDEKEINLGKRLSCRTRLLGNAEVVLKGDNQLMAEGATQDLLVRNADEIRCIGAAVDIGTTTVALSVYNLKTGICLATETMLNPQATISADVMGRIEAAMNGKLTQLREMVVGCIEKLAERSGYENNIDKWVITGNTTMLYLLTGRNPQALSAAPFVAEHLFGEEGKWKDKYLYIPKCMDAFVGADITCAVLESGMCDKAETSLLCDIGTNGELALWKNGRLYTASTAAGPAFEGAGISCGCQSVKGAIESVVLGEEGLKIQIIGNVKPIGFCGSGIIDAVACLLENGTIDETGAMEAEQIEICKGVMLKRGDVRALQLAKAAIAAGIKTLLEMTDTTKDEVATFYIAGGFGSHLNIDSAIRIGLVPEAFLAKIKVLGNAALKGAAAMLTDKTRREKEEQIVSKATCINLGGNPIFNENYIDEMLFPEQKNTWHMLRVAKEIGFSHYGLFKAEHLQFRQEVRDMCAAGRCGSYGKRWTCPPGCGTLEESMDKVRGFKEGILLQMTGEMEDDFDIECISETEKAIKEKLDIFVGRLREQGIVCLPMTAGTCTRCKECTYPNAPCRFPEKSYVSMEAYGLVVGDVCVLAKVPYNHGPRTITFTTCILFGE